MDKLLTRDEKCQISNADGFLTNSIQSVKRSLAKAFIERQSSLFHSRERRQISRGKIFRSIFFFRSYFQLKSIYFSSRNKFDVSRNSSIGFSDFSLNTRSNFNYRQ